MFQDDQEKEYIFRKECFERSGVLEYVAWFNSSNLPVWNRLINSEFKKIKEDEKGLIKSLALPGMWIPIDSLKNRDWWTVMATISRGITRREHRDFMSTIWKD